MAKKTAKQTRENYDRPNLTITPREVLEGDTLIVRGAGWGDCPLEIEIDGKAVRPSRIIEGFPVADRIIPDATGGFVASLSTFGLKPGKHELIVTSTHRRRRARVCESIAVVERPIAHFEPQREGDGRKKEDEGLVYLRALDFFKRRFGHIGFVPPGMRQVQIDQIRFLRKRRQQEPPQGGILSMPMPGVCNWNPVGAGPVWVGANLAWSGRTLCIAFDPVASSTIYIGTAGGGVWKSTDSGLTWSPKTDYTRSLAIGALAIDPNNNLRIFAGTGEYNNIGAGTYYGNGILRSEDGGNSWSELATSTFERDEISRILFDSTDMTSQQMFLSSDTGVYESLNGGVDWSLLRAGSASDLVMIANAGGPGNVKLIAAFKASGLWTSTKTAGVWSAWSQIASPSFPLSFARIAFGQSKNNPLTIYALFAGLDDIVGVAKTIDGGSGWTSVTVKLNIGHTQPSSNVLGHQHSVSIPVADLTGAPAAHTYTTTSAGSPAHTHTLSLTAAEIQQIAGGTNVSKFTTPDATGHQHSFLFKSTAQSWYNLHISVHPNNTDIVYFGEIGIWKNTTGGGVFNNVTSNHTDNHAFAFDPSDPDNVIWSCNDGGVFRSADGGANWANRNRDLATLQYRSISLHPLREAVMIGGTQDNGTHRYSGNPAWQLSAGGDGGFTAIDPGNPTRMYQEYVGSIFYRSDNAGEPGSWTPKNAGITGGSEFQSPFVLDPSDPNVCYFGGDRLWRSPDNADTWTAITGLPGTAQGLAADATAIAVHPSDPTTIYVGTTTGRVYQVHRTGATWTLPDITITDLTGPNLPPGVYVSDLAVDAAGTVWITIASVLWVESTGEFTNDHVYRRLAGGASWETRSSGLAQANPINTIVIDPMNSNRLFCGGDVGVFRTEDAGGMWIPWDEGLPNVPVFDLVIHGPRRLLRAATHGRSVWERPIDAGTCPMVDLYIRDNVLDTGRVLPSPDGVPHPFDPATLVRHWKSIDIKVDAEEGMPPIFQTPLPINDYVSFESALVHRNPKRTMTNRFYVQVHNRGVNKATNVQVRAFFCRDAHAGLPPLPADFWSGGKPFTGTPSGMDWVPIGPTQTFLELEAGEPGIKEWDWLVPGTANQHSCLLAVATCAEDPLDGTGITSADFLVLNRKQAALKNLQVEDAVMGMPLPPEGAYIVYLRAPNQRDSLNDVVLHWGSLPKGTQIFVAFEVYPRNKPAVLAEAEDLKRNGVTTSRRTSLFLEKQEGRCGDIRRFDLKRIYELQPSSDRTTIIPTVRIPYEYSLAMAINVILPENTKEEIVEFDVIQQSGKRIVGGNTYMLRPRKADKIKRNK